MYKIILTQSRGQKQNTGHFVAVDVYATEEKILKK